MNLKNYIREIPNWPIKGVNFKDITPMLQNGPVFRWTIDALAQRWQKEKIDCIVGIDARGFILAAALAYKLKLGLVIIRKKGKLPWKTLSQKYKLEYAINTIEIHADAVKPGERVLIVDDVLATGGTLLSTVKLVKRLGGKIVGISLLAELNFLKGREKLKGYRLHSLIQYDS